MNNILAQILQANKNFVAANHSKNYVDLLPAPDKLPSRQLAIFTCMDTRLVEFLEPAMGISRGQAKVIKNAGNSITGPFEATIRSLVISIFELGVKEIVVIGHLDCGLAATDSQKLIKKMLDRGISADAIKMIQKEMESWVDHFHHPLENVEEAVFKIRSNPLIPQDVPVHGLMFNPTTGELSVVVDGYCHTKPECQ